MFSKASLLASLVPFATAITFNTPTNAVSGQSVTISWSSTSSDPSVFTIELVNAPLLGTEIAIANNVPTSQGSVMVPALPIVPAASNYTIQAVDISNINSQFGTSDEFAIAAPASSVASTPTASAASSAASGLNSGSVSNSVTSASGAGPTSLITSPSGSATVASVNSLGTSANNASPSPTNFNGGAAGIHANAMYAGSCAVVAAGAIAILAGIAL